MLYVQLNTRYRIYPLLIVWNDQRSTPTGLVQLSAAQSSFHKEIP